MDGKLPSALKEEKGKKKEEEKKRRKKKEKKKKKKKRRKRDKNRGRERNLQKLPVFPEMFVFPWGPALS